MGLLGEIESWRDAHAFLPAISPEAAELSKLTLGLCLHMPCAHPWLLCSAIQIFLAFRSTLGRGEGSDIRRAIEFASFFPRIMEKWEESGGLYEREKEQRLGSVKFGSFCTMGGRFCVFEIAYSGF
jgi:hypothetical protein